MEREPRKPRTRANGEGSIYRVTVKGQSLWRATYTVGMKGRTAQKVSGTAATKTEAIRRRDRNLDRYKVSIGALPPEALRDVLKHERLTTSEVLSKWLAWKTTTTDYGHKVGPNVARMYQRSVALHIAPHVGHHYVRLLRKADLVELLTETLPAKKKQDGTPLLGASPLRQVRNILTMALAWAVEQEFLVKSPADNLPNFAKPQKEGEDLEHKRWIPRELIKRLAGTDEEATWILGFAGLRQSERLGISYDCFNNLDGKKKGKPVTLEVRQQLWRDPKTGEISIKHDTKTKAGKRIIPLSGEMVAILRRHKRRQDALKALPTWKPLPGMENLVFTEKDGRPVRHQTDNKRWRALLERENIPFIRGHALRHIAISILISEGAPIEIVRSIAGHADAEITRAVYTHLGYKPSVAPMEALTANLFQKVNVKPSSSAA